MRLCLVPHDSPSLVSRLIFCFPDLKFLLLSWLSRASLVVQTIKNLPAMQETLVRPLGQEDPLEKGSEKELRWQPRGAEDTRTDQPPSQGHTQQGERQNRTEDSWSKTQIQAGEN